MARWWKCDYCGATEDGTEYPEGWELNAYEDVCADCIARDEADDEDPSGDPAANACLIADDY